MKNEKGPSKNQKGKWTYETWKREEGQKKNVRRKMYKMQEADGGTFIVPLLGLLTVVMNVVDIKHEHQILMHGFACCKGPLAVEAHQLWRPTGCGGYLIAIQLHCNSHFLCNMPQTNILSKHGSITREYLGGVASCAA